MLTSTRILGTMTPFLVALVSCSAPDANPGQGESEAVDSMSTDSTISNDTGSKDGSLDSAEDTIDTPRRLCDPRTETTRGDLERLQSDSDCPGTPPSHPHDCPDCQERPSACYFCPESRDRDYVYQILNPPDYEVYGMCDGKIFKL